MTRIFAFCALIIVSACSNQSNSISGLYDLEVNGLKNQATGSLEIVGEPGDYFGKITLNTNRIRVYELGLKYETSDSLYFIAPGKGGYLSLKRADSIWVGQFKYFGIQAEITALRVGNASEELTNLVSLKPIGVGSVSTDSEESFPSFDAANQALYFTRDSKLFSSEYLKETWSEPILLPFSQEFNDSAPYIFNDGNSLLFTSNRPLENSSEKKKNLWISERIDGTWADPYSLPSPINVDSLGDYHAAISDLQDYYFISYNRPGGFGRSDIYFASKIDEDSFKVSNLGEIINSDLSEADVYVHPDEKYILFASTGRIDSYGADDIYISYNRNGSWSEPQNLGPAVNSFAYEYGAWVDEANGYLYFNSYRRGTSDIYRVPLTEISVFE